MTALDEVLTAEKEAEQTVAKANKDAAVALQNARVEQQTSLETEEKRLAEAAIEAAAAEEVRVTELAKKITAEVSDQVVAIEKRFVSKKDDLKSAIMQKFQ